MQLSVLREDNHPKRKFYQVPTKYDVMAVADKRMLRWYEAIDIPYLSVIRDLMLAGF